MLEVVFMCLHDTCATAQKSVEPVWPNLPAWWHARRCKGHKDYLYTCKSDLLICCFEAKRTDDKVQEPKNKILILAEVIRIFKIYFVGTCI